MDSTLDLSKEIEEILAQTICPMTAKEVQEYANRTNGTIDFILHLCEQYLQHLDMATAEIITSKYNTKTAHVRKSAKTKYTWAALNTYGAKIIFLVRALLTEEEINFLFGVSSNERTSKQVLLTQNEVLKNLEAKKKSSGIGIILSNFQEQLKSVDEDTQISERGQKRVNEWNEVMKLGTVERYSKQDPAVIGDGHDIYQKISGPDYRVWVKFSGKKHSRSYYYDLGNRGKAHSDDFRFYNIGWLWQWYNQILRGSNDQWYQFVSESINIDQSIAPIISTVENIAGTKQGDIKDSTSRQIQTKFNNKVIISYNNIKVILIELTKALRELKASSFSDASQENARQILQEHFYPDAKLVGNEAANKEFKRLMNTLQSGLKLNKN